MAATNGGARERSDPKVFTFLFSDIEGSTRLAERLGAQFVAALGTHHEILYDVISEHGGVVRNTEGDSFFATFDAATAAIAAAVAVQRRLAAQAWPPQCSLRVRMGLHTGEAAVVANEFVGIDVHRAARIMSIGWGGQILVSSTTRALIAGGLTVGGQAPGVVAAEGVAPEAGRALPDDDIDLRDLGTHALKDLTDPEHIYQVVVADLRSDFPALRSKDAVPNNLPTPLTSFVGRRREVTEVLELLHSNRLLTLTGPGGTGKTRLSLQVGHEMVGEYPDGVFFVRLASVFDPALVMSAVATALGLAPSGRDTPLEVVSEHLKSRRTLLILDNFEQVLPAATDVSTLLGATRDVTVLISSRSALHISGEQEYAVPPLPLPSADYGLEEVASSDAAMLFVARAAAVQPGFRLDKGNARAISDITRRLDGLPLAIELAAARVKVLSVEAIASRLGDALNLLSAGARDTPDRQRTLRGTIAWSYDLLSPPARRLFTCVSVFRGGVDYDHLAEVCDPGDDHDLLDLVTELVDQSLLRRVDVATGVRFAMLETIREYAAERLEESGERDALYRRHAAVYRAVAEEAAPLLTGDQSLPWLDRLERDHDNLRAALHRAADGGDTRTALRLVAALWRMWQIRGHLYEGRRNVDRVLELPDAGQYPADLAAAYEADGSIAYWQGQLAESTEPYGRALELYRESGNEAAIARATYNLAFSYLDDDPARSLDIFEQALAAYERIGDEMGVARSHWGLSVGYLWSGDYEAVLPHGDQCLPVFRAAGRSFDLAWALHLQGSATYALGHYEAARALFTEALEIFAEAGDATGLYLVFADFATLAEAEGDLARALRLFAAVDRLGDDTGAGLFRNQLRWLPRATHADEQLDPVTVEAHRAEGYAMTRDEAVAYALERWEP